MEKSGGLAVGKVSFCKDKALLWPLDHPPTDMSWSPYSKGGKGKGGGGKGEGKGKVGGKGKGGWWAPPGGKGGRGGYRPLAAAEPRAMAWKRQRTDDKDALPVLAHKESILSALDDEGVLLISGDTGCGKSTQVPQFLLDADPANKIVVTQPRRLAARALAERVSNERGSVIGRTVGYALSRDRVTTLGTTRVTFMTTGLLLQVAASLPPCLSACLPACLPACVPACVPSCLLADGAHTRVLVSNTSQAAAGPVPAPDLGPALLRSCIPPPAPLGSSWCSDQLTSSAHSRTL